MKQVFKINNDPSISDIDWRGTSEGSDAIKLIFECTCLKEDEVYISPTEKSKLNEPNRGDRIYLDVFHYYGDKFIHLIAYYIYTDNTFVLIEVYPIQSDYKSLIKEDDKFTLTDNEDGTDYSIVDFSYGT